MKRIINIEILKSINIIIYHLNLQKAIIKKMIIIYQLNILLIILIPIKKRMRITFLPIMKIIIIKMK